MREEIRISLSPKDVKMIEDEVLSRFYTSMTKIYCGRRIPTYIVDDCPSTDGNVIYMAEAKELKEKASLNRIDYNRINFDMFAHECTHINNHNTGEQIEQFLSDVGANVWAKICLNAVEDSRVDMLRARKYPGMVVSQAFSADMNYKYIREPLDGINDKTKRIIEGTIQVLCSGKVKAKNLDKDEESFFTTVRNVLYHARRCKEYKTRKLLAQYLIDEGMKLGINPPPIYTMRTVCGPISIKGFGDGTKIIDLPDFLKEKIRKALEQNKLFNDEEDDSITDIKSNIKDENASSREWYGLDPNRSLDPNRTERIREEHLQEAMKKFALECDKDQIIKAVEKSKLPRTPFNKRTINANSIIAELDNLLRRIKQASTRKPSKKGKRINIRRFVRYVAGSPNQDFYYKDSITRPGDRSICILIDCSGSMYRMIDSAALAAYAIAYVSEKLDDKTCVLGYYNTDVIKIKSWNDPVRKSDFEHLFTGGYTPTPLGLKTAMHFLDIATKPKKLLIVIEDGNPNVPFMKYYGLSSDAFVQCQQIVSYIRGKGIKVLGIYIGNPSIRRRMQSLYGRDHFMVIPSVRYLPKALFTYYLREMGL